MIEVLEKSLNRTLGLKKDLVVGDPYEVIPIKDRKYASSTAEVYLGRRGIQMLVNFDHFKNLEVVWLNGNKLKTIEGLDSNFRIKELYLHDNQIKSLEGSLKNLLHLRTLALYNNELSDLDGVLKYFEGMTYLVHLELHDNPLSEEQHYKRRVVHALKRLQIFDRHSSLG
jgi:Leucine-rich repeat (LRR) protein